MARTLKSPRAPPPPDPPEGVGLPELDEEELLLEELLDEEDELELDEELEDDACCTETTALALWTEPAPFDTTT